MNLLSITLSLGPAALPCWDVIVLAPPRWGLGFRTFPLREVCWAPDLIWMWQGPCPGLGLTMSLAHRSLDSRREDDWIGWAGGVCMCVCVCVCVCVRECEQSIPTLQPWWVLSYANQILLLPPWLVGGMLGGNSKSLCSPIKSRVVWPCRPPSLLWGSLPGLPALQPPWCFSFPAHAVLCIWKTPSAHLPLSTLVSPG